MAKVKFFSHLRRDLGTSEVDIAAGNVAELISALEGRYGAAFSDRIGHCKVYVNGTNVGLGKGRKTRLSDGDEVVVLPPVAGG